MTFTELDCFAAIAPLAFRDLRSQGWTRIVYGRVIQAEYGKEVKTFDK